MRQLKEPVLARRWLFALALAGLAAGSAATSVAQPPPYCEHNYCNTFLIDECKPIDLDYNCDETSGGGCSTRAC